MKRTAKVNENGEIPMEAFRDIVDLDVVRYYSVEAVEGGLKVTFYDENKNVIIPKGEVNGQ